MEGVDDAGVYWELIAFWSSGTVDVSKKVTTVPSASFCTYFIRYRRNAMMQFNDSEMQMGRKENEAEKDLYIDLKNYMLYILICHAALNAACFSVSLCLHSFVLSL